MTSLPKVAICYTSSDVVHADFALALAGLCNSAPPLKTTIINAKSSIIAIARNQCVHHAQEFGADYMLFLDSDMVFPRTVLLRLLAHQRDIVGATYTKRVKPYTVLGASVSGCVIESDGHMLEMTQIPTGCLLIQMGVFDTLNKPYFRFDVDEASGDVLGEDYVFCARVRSKGFRIWCDSKLSGEIGHIGQKIYQIKNI